MSGDEEAKKKEDEKRGREKEYSPSSPQPNLHLEEPGCRESESTQPPGHEQRYLEEVGRTSRVRQSLTGGLE